MHTQLTRCQKCQKLTLNSVLVKALFLSDHDVSFYVTCKTLCLKNILNILHKPFDNLNTPNVCNRAIKLLC